MPKPFHCLSLNEFAELLRRYPFSRRITAVHLHHTWRPRCSDFAARPADRRVELIEAMWEHHTKVRGFSDIAQHLTIDPGGGLWTGRNPDRPPASARGHNGNAVSGPYMIEMIGDFGAPGSEPEALAEPQRGAAVGAAALVCRRFGLAARDVLFHNQMSEKTCPGTTIDYDRFVTDVAAAMERLEGDETARAQARGGGPGPGGGAAVARLVRAIDDLQREDGDLPRGLAGEEDEPEEEAVPAEAPGGRGAEGVLELTPEILEALRPHVVNLRQGRFSDFGRFYTRPEDVDALFAEYLPAFWHDRRAAGDKTLRVVLFAHGGLVAEGAGLRIAAKHVDWWKANGIYPIYFIWETGLGETLHDLLASSDRRLRAERPRDLFDFTTDPVLELVVRPLGEVVWAGIKRSAEAAAAPDGGGAYVARRLRQFVTGFDGSGGASVEIHAAGHSAGAVFHAHFLPALVKGGPPSPAPRIENLCLLAPACRVDLFKARLLPLLGGSLQRLAVFTMSRHFERRDATAFVYRKSLLYLIHHALEPERRAPILGLEDSLRRDEVLASALGLRGTGNGVGEVVFSPTAAANGRAASQARSHGAFDDDPATMDSIAHRILGGPPPVPYRAGAGRRGFGEVSLADLVRDPADLPEPATELVYVPGAAIAAGVSPAAIALPLPGIPAVHGLSPAGRRLALCIGIDEYPAQPLAGCVADARAWQNQLGSLDFEVEVLLNGRATFTAILEAIGTLLRGSAAGDVVVIQYSGHGTQLPDLNGDEPTGFDQAVVPVNFEEGQYLLDDDLGALYDQTPTGVNLTLFFDCCHSGTSNRMALLSRAAVLGEVADTRMRFLRPDPQREAAHRAFRARSRAAARVPRAGVRRAPGPEVLFAACQDHQFAWETSGSGDFTRAALARLVPEVAAGTTNRAFHDRLLAELDPVGRQHPKLTCDPVLEALPLLAARVAAAFSREPAVTGRLGELAALLRVAGSRG